jgi:Family of unknown function (DUF6459)
MQQNPAKDGPGNSARPADAIRRLVVPQVAPPYDDELGGSPACPGGDRHEEGNAGCLAVPAVVPPGPRADPTGAGQPVSPQVVEKPITPRNPGSPGVGAGWPGQFAQALAETLAGSRPHRQLTPWTTEQVRRQIRQLGPLFATGDRPLVRRIMTTTPATGVLELTAVVGFGPRVRVLALRLEREGAGRAWCCTAIESA